MPRTRKELAQTMVEFALVFPVLLLITYGIMEFGRMLFIYSVVTNSAREGSRYGAAVGSNTLKNYMDCNGIRAAVRKVAVLAPISDTDIYVWYDHGPGTTPFPSSTNICPPGTGQYSNDLLHLGDRIGVRVVFNYQPIIAFLKFNGFNITSENARTVVMHVKIGN